MPMGGAGRGLGGRIQKLPTGRGSRHHYYISSRLHSTQDFHASTVHWTWRALHVRTGKHRSASPAVASWGMDGPVVPGMEHSGLGPGDRGLDALDDWDENSSGSAGIDMLSTSAPT